MDEAVSGSGRNKKFIFVAAAGILLLFLVVGIGFWVASRPTLISPLSESGETRVVFITPEPRASAESEASSSAQPSGTVAPKATVKSSPRQSPKATSKPSPAQSPVNSATPSASTP